MVNHFLAGRRPAAEQLLLDVTVRTDTNAPSKPQPRRQQNAKATENQEESFEEVFLQKRD